jgi:UDP-GlcNAc:undecaprenyl-phosphate GlcNAc-1-phosphate transferase
MNGTFFIAAGLGWGVTILGAFAILYVVKQWPFYAREDGRAIGGLALVPGILVGGAVIIPSIDPFLLLGAGVIILIGLIDDRIDLSPWQKLVGQGIAAALATAGLSSIEAVSLGVPLPLGSVQWIVTFLWILTLINAANLIDGLDGLLITVLAPSFGALAIVAILEKNVMGGVLSLAALGALLGFYPLNRHHGRLLLGDTGAEFIGYLLALLTLTIFQRGEGEWAVVPALLIAAVPLSDTTFAVLRRLVHHRSIFRGDREHIHHRLAAHRGERKAVITLGIVSLLTSVLALLLWRYGT